MIGSIHGWRQVARRFRRRFANRALILLYHRVVDLPSDPHLLAVTPAHFAEHLEVIRRWGRPMRLVDLCQSVAAGHIPHRAVVVTLDDGYVDNLTHATPLLEGAGVPATVFVTSGFVGRRREFWWDDLDRLLLQPGRLPATLRLTLDGAPWEAELGEAACYSLDDQHRDRHWSLEALADPGPRQRLFRSLFDRLRLVPDHERRRALCELAEWAGASAEGRETHRALSEGELIGLANSGAIDIGAHTVTHSQLSALPPSAQRDEIRESKARLEDLLGRPVTTFAYPFGGASHYTAETVTAVLDVGYISACANIPDVVSRGVDLHQLPRFLVRDWDGDVFARRLDAWFSG